MTGADWSNALNGSLAGSPVFQGSLRKYQQSGVLWLKALGARSFNLILADEMGLGKNPLPLSDFETEYPAVERVLSEFLSGGKYAHT